MRISATTARFVAVTAAAFVAAEPASAACTRLAFSVNDYGKDGPTRDAKQLLDTYIAKWTADRGIKKYRTGPKDVNCELFLNLIVFDEHTCRAEATVCWDGPAVPGTVQAAAPGEATKTAAPAPAPGVIRKSAVPRPTPTEPPKAEAPAAAPTVPAAPAPKSAAVAPAAEAAPKIETGTVAPAKPVSPPADIPAKPTQAKVEAVKPADSVTDQALLAAQRAAAAAERAAAAAERAAAAAAAAEKGSAKTP